VDPVDRQHARAKPRPLKLFLKGGMLTALAGRKLDAWLLIRLTILVVIPFDLLWFQVNKVIAAIWVVAFCVLVGLILRSQPDIAPREEPGKPSH
jgi:hypothetical protein